MTVERVLRCKGRCIGADFGQVRGPRLPWSQSQGDRTYDLVGDMIEEHLTDIQTYLKNSYDSMGEDTHDESGVPAGFDHIGEETMMLLLRTLDLVLKIRS